MAVTPVLDDPREQRNHDNGKDDKGEVAFHDRDVAEEITGKHKRQNPQKRAENAEGKKPKVGHATDTRHEWHERADDGKKSSDHHGLGPMARVKFLCAFQMPGVEKPRIVTAEHLGPQ